VNGPIDQALRRRQLESFAGLLAEKRRRQAKVEHQTRGYRDEAGVWRGGLLSFMRYFWHILEPGKKLTEGWVLEALCEHLEACAFGDIKRLLITVPPGCSKSMLTDVFLPAWLWAIGRPELRFVAFSYTASLTERDNGRFRDLITHPEFQALYRSVFTLRKTGETKITNNHHGWKLATSVGGVGTGERADFLLCDDLHNVKESESEDVRKETVRWFRESASDRLNDMTKGAIIVIMQRVHEDDVAGVILADEFDYVHLCIPMEFVWDADEDGEPYATEIGWVDPRWREDPEECDGALMWPERFPEDEVEKLKKIKGPYAYAAQYQQTPEARGGGILKRDFWQQWTGKFPSFSYIFASLDGAFTEDESNDPSALSIWGVFENEAGHNRAMLIFAWRKFLEFEGQRLRPEKGENQRDFMERQMKEWGLIEWTAHTCTYWKVDRLLIEAKASGISAAQSLQKRYRNRNWSVELTGVKGDKVSRAIAVQPTLSNKMVYAPLERDWCRMVIDEAAIFPFGKHDDCTDTVTQALKHLRDLGLLEFDDDIRAEELRNAQLPEKDNKLKNYLPGT
jgi:predicted phage terminase large subunit-like protein